MQTVKVSRYLLGLEQMKQWFQELDSCVHPSRYISLHIYRLVAPFDYDN